MLLLRGHVLPRQPYYDRSYTIIVRMSNGYNKWKLCDDEIDASSTLYKGLCEALQ